MNTKKSAMAQQFPDSFDFNENGSAIQVSKEQLQVHLLRLHICMQFLLLLG